MELLDAWQRRKHYEAKLLSIEIVSLLAQALNAGGTSGSGGERWVEPEEMMRLMGATLE